MAITLYELAGPDGRHYSVFSWRTRLALAHKGLDWTSQGVKVTDKAAIAFSGQKKVPIIRDGERIVFDSLRIAEYLESAYPNRPTLFGGETGQAMARFFNSWCDRQLIATLFLSLMLENTQRVAADDAAHIRAGVEGPTKKTLEEHFAGKDAAIKAFNRLLDPVRSALRSTPYLGGSEPRYVDHILFSVLQWPRITTPTPILAPDDAVGAWFERMLDAYGGLGRAERAAT